jgi:hypothetical protein
MQIYHIFKIGYLWIDKLFLYPDYCEYSEDGCVASSLADWLIPFGFNGMELLDYMVALFLILWGIFILFSLMSVVIYIPTNSI